MRNFLSCELQEVDRIDNVSRIISFIYFIFMMHNVWPHDTVCLIYFIDYYKIKRHAKLLLTVLALKVRDGLPNIPVHATPGAKPNISFCIF